MFIKFTTTNTPVNRHRDISPTKLNTIAHTINATFLIMDYPLVVFIPVSTVNRVSPTNYLFKGFLCSPEGREVGGECERNGAQGEEDEREAE